MNIGDLAIEYRSKVLMIKSKIKNLDSIGINVEKYLEQLERIEKEVSELVINYNKDITNEKMYKMCVNDLNSIYRDGVVKLVLLDGELFKYDSYLKGYSYCKYVESKIDSEETSEQLLSKYAQELGNFINLINNTDTRDYSEEGSIVEKIYETSYLIMKLEFIKFGKSKIFDMAKENPVVEAFINDCIVRDIENLKQSGKDTKLMNQAISRIQSNGINATYLDEALITSITLNDDNSIVNKINDKLNELAKKIKTNSDDINKAINDLKYTRGDISESTNTIRAKRKENTKEIMKRVIAGLIVLSSFLGSYFLARRIARVREYKTTKETFSSVAGYSSEEGYETKVDDDYKDTKLYVYEPYEELGRWEAYRRDYTVYDIGNISENCETLDDYLKLNLDHAASLAHSVDDKFASTMTEEDFYDGTVTEVVKITQDESDINEYTSTAGTVVLTILFSLLLGLIEGFVLHQMWYQNVFDYLEDIGSSKDELKRRLIRLKDELADLKVLLDNNKTLKSEFAEVYDNYKLLLESGEFDKIIEGVLIEDPQIELDRRTKRLLRSKVADKDLF